MNRIILIALVVFTSSTAFAADCRNTGSSFSRNSRACDESAVTQNYNSYVYNYYVAPRPYYRYYPRDIYTYRDDTPRNKKRELESSPNRVLDRSYAPGFGTSFPMPR